MKRRQQSDNAGIRLCRASMSQLNGSNVRRCFGAGGLDTEEAQIEKREDGGKAYAQRSATLATTWPDVLIPFAWNVLHGER